MKSSGRISRAAMRSAVMAGVLLVLLSSSIAVACDPGPGKIEAYPSAFFSNTNGGSTNLYYHVEVSNSCVQIVVQKGSDVVKTFSPGVKGPGLYSVSWSGKDSNGNNVAEGAYTAVLKIGVNGATPTPKDSCAVGIDNTAPTTTYAFSKDKKSDDSYPTGVKLSFSASDTGGSGLCSIYYMCSRCDRESCCNDEFRQYCGPIQFCDPGVYTVTFKAVDCAGNLEKVNGAYRTVTFTVTGASAPACNPTACPNCDPTACPTACPTDCPTVCPNCEPTETPAPTEAGQVLMTETVSCCDQPTATPAPTALPDGDTATVPLSTTTTFVVAGAASMLCLLGAALFFWKG